MAHSPRGWTGARTPQAIKRVRQTERRRAINQPRRSAAKTLVSKAILTAGNGSAEEAQEALARAVSALDRAAKTGAMHKNAADRRKSRLTLKINAALVGEAVVGTAKTGRATGKAAAAKQARARIAAGRAEKAKGAQTAAGKARAALARTTRGDTATSADAATSAAPEAPAAPATRTRTQKTTGAAKSAGTAAKSRTTAKASGETAAKPRRTKTEKAG